MHLTIELILLLFLSSSIFLKTFFYSFGQKMLSISHSSSLLKLFASLSSELSKLSLALLLVSFLVLLLQLLLLIIAYISKSPSSSSSSSELLSSSSFFSFKSFLSLSTDLMSDLLISKSSFSFSFSFSSPFSFSFSLSFFVFCFSSFSFSMNDLFSFLIFILLIFF